MRLAIFAAGIVIADAIRPIESDWQMVLLVIFPFGFFVFWDAVDYTDES